MTRVCSCCKMEKSTDEFHKRGSHHKSHCKECRKINENEAQRVRALDYRSKNLEKIRASQAEYNKRQDVKAKRNIKNKERRKSDSQYRLKHNLRCRITKCIKNKSKNTISLLGCSIDQFKVYIESKFTDGMSWDNYGEWHIDHITPCISFDLLDPKQQEICFHYTNLQPLWAIDNLKKGGKIPLLGD